MLQKYSYIIITSTSSKFPYHYSLGETFWVTHPSDSVFMLMLSQATRRQ